EMIVLTRLAAGLICAIWVCRDAPPVEHISAPASDLISLRNEVREIIRPKCGSCHTSSLPTAKPKAVAVFDLTQEDWPGGMSARQLEKFKNRLSSLGDSLTRKVDEFVSNEIARRNTPGS